MKFLGKLFTGDITLWCTLWLVTTPLVIIWDVSGICILTRCRTQSHGSRADLFITGFLIALFALSNVGVAVVSGAIWRNSSKLRRDVWRGRLLAFSAKLYAALTGSGAIVILLFILYDVIHYVVTRHT